MYEHTLILILAIFWDLAIAVDNQNETPKAEFRSLSTPNLVPINTGSDGTKLPLYVRNPFSGHSDYIEVDSEANVADLMLAIHDQLAIDGEFVISFAGQELLNAQAPLMDIGLSAESTVNIDTVELSRIMEFLGRFQSFLSSTGLAR